MLQLHPMAYPQQPGQHTQAATITAYHGHTSAVFAVVWSPDGTRLASGGNDSTVQVWERRYIQKLPSLSPDGDQWSRMFPVHQSPSVLLLRDAFDKGDQRTVGTDDNTLFCSPRFERG
jgi:WD40 repeat protein